MKPSRPSVAVNAERTRKPIASLVRVEQVVYLCRRVAAPQVVTEDAAQIGNAAHVSFGASHAAAFSS